MPVITQPVTCQFNDQNGNGVAGATVTFKLNRREIYLGIVAPERIEAIANASGLVVVNLFPNALGAAGSLYSVKAYNPDAGKIMDTFCSVPNSPSNLHQILTETPYPTVDASQAALVAAQGALAAVTTQAGIATAGATTATTQAGIATAQAVIATTQASNASTSATNASTSATNAGISATAASGSAATASAVLANAAFIAVNAGLTNITTVANNIANVNTVAGISGNVTTVAGISAAVSAVNANAANVNAVAAVAASIPQVAAVAASVATVAPIAANVTTVAGVAAAVTTVAANSSNVGVVAGISGNVTAVAGVAANVTTVAGVAVSVATVAGVAANVATVATNIAAVNTNAANIAAIQGAAANAGIASASAIAANASAGAASGSAASALAIFGNTAAMNAAGTAAANSASNAAASALSASSVVQQDLSAIAAALHRSPNAITALFVYDTAKDSDAGAWRKRMRDKSWMTEPLGGKWLNAHATESLARTIGASTYGSELVTNGTFDTNTTGWTAGAQGALSAVGGTLRVTLVSDGFGRAISSAIATVAGRTYRVSVMPVSSVATGASGIAMGASSSNDSTSLELAVVAVPVLGALAVFTFIATGSASYVKVGTSSGWLTGNTANFDNISCQEIVTQTATTGDFFQLTTDGRFYGLNKNRLLSTATLGTQTVQLGAGTYTLSSTTGSTGSVAISGTFVTGTPVTHTSPTATTFVVTAGSNVTFTVTGSVLTAQCELSAVATTYQANTGTSVTETFRGNTAEAPALPLLVAEAARLVIYAGDQPGRPMWAVIVTSGALAVGNINGIAALNGSIQVAGSSGLGRIDLAADFIRVRTSAAVTRQNSIATRNTAALLPEAGPAVIVNSGVNAVAMTVLPDAPFDPVTGLQIPTIAVATAGGVSVIRHDGTVVTPLGGLNRVFFRENGDIITGDSASTELIRVAFAPRYAADFTTIYAVTATLPPVGPNLGKNAIAGGRGRFAVATNSGVHIARENRSTTTATLVATIQSLFNTGYMTGDIRRCLLSSNVVGSISSPELVTNGTFDVNTAGWTGSNATLSVVGAALRITVTANGAANGSRAITCVVGTAYLASMQVTADAVTGNMSLSVGTALGGASTATVALASGTGTISVAFIATTTAHFVSATAAAGALAAETFDVDNISVREVIADRSYRNQPLSIFGTLTTAVVGAGCDLVAYSGFSAANYAQQPFSADLDFGVADWTAAAFVNIPTGNVAAATILARSFSSGPSITFGITSGNLLTASVFDGTTTRTVTSAVAYNSATPIKARVSYRTDGSLTLLVNAVQVGQTIGAPLLTLNNASAVLTVGNNRDLNAAFPGSITLVKLGATVPTTEQAQWMYAQEAAMFQAGAKCVLPDSNAIIDLAYDDLTDQWNAITSANESTFTGLVRTATAPVSSGTFSRSATQSGVKLLSRATTIPGVDVTIPAYGLREELVRRGEAAAAQSRTQTIFDYVGGFTATTTTAAATANTLTAVSGVTPNASHIGMFVTGSGIPASTNITGFLGAVFYISKPATAAASGVSISFTDFALPVGYTATTVANAGTLREEGASKTWTRLFDGQKETIRFGTAPGVSAWVQIVGRKV